MRWILFSVSGSNESQTSEKMRNKETWSLLLALQKEGAVSILSSRDKDPRREKVKWKPEQKLDLIVEIMCQLQGANEKLNFHYPSGIATGEKTCMCILLSV